MMPTPNWLKPARWFEGADPDSVPERGDAQIPTDRDVPSKAEHRREARLGGAEADASRADGPEPHATCGEEAGRANRVETHPRVHGADGQRATIVEGRVIARRPTSEQNPLIDRAAQ